MKNGNIEQKIKISRIEQSLEALDEVEGELKNLKNKYTKNRYLNSAYNYLVKSKKCLSELYNRLTKEAKNK